MKKNIKPANAIAAAPPTPTPTPIGTALLFFSADGVSVEVAPPDSPAAAPAPVSVPVPSSAVVDGGVVVVEALVREVVEVVFVLEMEVTPKSIVVIILPARADTTWVELLQSHPPRP